MKLFRIAAASLALSCVVLATAVAQNAPCPSGQVLLTITGEVGRANRGPRDDWADKLMTFQDTAFDKAMEFDAAMLEALGTRKLRVHYKSWPAGHEFEGPLLKDVLAAAGVAGGTVQPVAVDGYAADIPYSDVEKYPVIVALKMDGRRLPIGGAGPTFVVYPINDYPDLAKGDDAKLVWGVSHIRVLSGK